MIDAYVWLGHAISRYTEVTVHVDVCAVLLLPRRLRLLRLLVVHLTILGVVVFLLSFRAAGFL